MSGLFDDAEVISVYSAAQAVDDGFLVQVEGRISRSESNAVYGNDLCFAMPVYITTNLFTRIEREDPTEQEVRTRLLLNAAFTDFKNGDPTDLMRTSIDFEGERVWGVIDGAGLTVMLPEDY